MKAIPLFGSGVKSYSTVVTSQRRVNCFYDVRPDQDKAGVIVVGTPGSQLSATLPGTTIQGWRVVGDYLYVVCSSVLYRFASDMSHTALATLGTAGLYVGMADCTSQIIIVDGYAGYVYTIATATLTTITDANFPGVSTGTAPTSVAFLNGSFYVPVPGSRTFIKSQPLDGLTWTPYVFGTKENSSDSVVGIDVINGTLVVYGSQTMEFWQDAGLSPLPVQRINGATQNWGVAAVFSWAHAGSTAMFLGVNPDGNNRIVVLNGYTPVPVSDPDIDAILDSSYLLGGSTALVYSVLGHSMYQITVQGRTLVYDLTTKMWHEAQTGTVDNARHIGNLSVAFNNNNYISDYAAPKIYLLNPSVYTDNGTTIVRQVCTRHIRSDGNELFLGQLALEFETGVANSDSTNPTVNIYVSRDGGHTFGPAKPKPLGAAGAYIRRARWKRLGSGIDIVIKIVVTDPVKFVLASGQASVDVVDD